MAGTSVSFVFFILFLLIGLTFTICSDPYIRREHRRNLLLIIGLCVSLIVQNCWEYVLITGPTKQLERKLVSIYGYAVRPVIIVLMYPLVAPKKRCWPAWVLVGINAAVHMTALFSHICFTITADNHYYGGLLSHLCLYVSIALLIYLLYLTFHEHRNIHILEAVTPLMTVAVILVSAWLNGTTLEGDQLVDYVTIAISVSCVSYYIWLHLRFVRQHEEALEARQRGQIMMAQIQPQFLLNNLSAIQALCRTDPQKAADTAESFGDYLRQNLSFLNEPGLIPFDRELEHTRIYAEIEETRSPNIHVRYQIQDSDFSLPPLTLQPLVENAILHGVRIREEGIVDIITREGENCHEILVRDNGVGFDPQMLENADENHIGFRNVRDRVERMCGGTMTVDSRVGEGTSVKILLPAGKNRNGKG